MNRRLRLGVLVVLLSVLATPARADVAIPALALIWPLAWIVFLPVVLLEAWVAKRQLGLAFAAAMKLSLKANAWSTLLGVPLSYLLVAATAVVGGILLNGNNSSVTQFLAANSIIRALGYAFTAAVMVMEGLPDWAVPAGWALLCAPCYALSVRIEAWSAAKTVSRNEARRWARAANRVSYSIFIVVLGVISIAEAIK